MPLASGTQLGPYEILAPLGAGGMGEVYRARDTKLGRDVALKILPADVSASADRLARFEKEARAVAALNHPNIVTLHTMEEAQGVRFLTMELVEGSSLDREIGPGGLPAQRAIELGIAMADALVAAHEKGVVHRDLKPANVMLTRDGRVKVLDFGLAKLVSADAELTFAATGEVVGTVPYMAPEQLRGDAVDARTDLFALGVVLYELASGKRPFTGETHVDVSHAILREKPEPLPDELGRVILRCLEKNPRERFQTALDVSNELRSLRKTLEGGPPRPKPANVASIAVLPFANRSASPDDEYFSEGLADELLGVLSKIKGLRVTARTSSFQFKDTKDDVPTIGRKLDVTTVLEGSVRKAGNRIRVSVQLVDVKDSSHLWSETYDRTLDDIFAVQDDIAHSVVKELRTTLLGETADSDASAEAKAEVRRASRGRATDPEAFRLYLLGRHLSDRYEREDMARAIEYLKQALERDPDFAAAWAELGRAYFRQVEYGWAPNAEGHARGRKAVERALSLEPDLADAHAILARIEMMYERNWQAAKRSMARALELQPDSAEVRRSVSGLIATLGRLDEAIELNRRGVEDDPLNANFHHNLGNNYSISGRFSEAEAEFRRAIELSPQSAGTRAYLGFALSSQGRHEEALAEAQQEPVEVIRLWATAILHHAAGRTAESDTALQALIDKYAVEAPFQVAEVHAFRREADAAFEWLERAYEGRDPGVSEVRISSCLRSVHEDPRWSAFLEKMGFPN